MAQQFFAGLLNGGFRMPDAAINYGSRPLPTIPPGASQFTSADGVYNAASALLPGGLGSPYAYGTSARISTQTQMAHPNRVALVVPKLFIPSPESDGLDHTDPVLQHAISDGDLVFSCRMGLNMSGHTVAYFAAPHGFADRAVKLINLPTVNYILWGLQVGLFGPKKTRWRSFFNHLTRTGFRLDTATIDEDVVWNFIQTYLRPFAVQHGGDQQGGMHEGDTNRVVTHGAVDYVSSFAIEGKLRHVNNLWRDHDVRENDDLVLALRHKAPPHSDLQFVLSSSVRATRNERVPVNGGFFYLRPEVLQHRSYSDVPYIHIGRSQLYCSAYTRGVEACCWNARMPVTPGAPLLMTFEPCFVCSDRMFYRMHEIEDDDDGEDAAAAGTLLLASSSRGVPAAAPSGSSSMMAADGTAAPSHHVRFTRAGLPSAPPPPAPPVASTGQGMLLEPRPKRKKVSSSVSSMLQAPDPQEAAPAAAAAAEPAAMMM
jgi:hypothetical protein